MARTVAVVMMGRNKVEVRGKCRKETKRDALTHGQRHVNVKVKATTEAHRVRLRKFRRKRAGRGCARTVKP